VSGVVDATEVLVIGSGAGGALTAARLAAAGRQVTVLEEGPALDPDARHAFSRRELESAYRNRGVTATLGRPPIAYVEGCCVGGSTEVNSGLWHRPPADLVARWAERGGVRDLDPDDLDRRAARIERELGVAAVPGGVPRSSALLGAGADALGWQAGEVPRVAQYPTGVIDAEGATQQTMARTYLPAAEASGAVVLPGCRVDRLVRHGRRAVGAAYTSRRSDGTVTRGQINAEVVVLAAGAVQTPALLQRSGVRGPVGRGLKVHPTVKLVARFPHGVDHDTVPMHQVKEFAPDLSLGGSASRPGQLALALADTADAGREALAHPERLFVYYAAIRSEGSGRVLAVPGLRAPVVTYRLTEADMSRLARGLVHLGELLFAAGADTVYPSVGGSAPWHTRADLGRAWSTVERGQVTLMTVHLCASLRMGEDPSRTGTDSFGRVHGLDNVWVNDASLLPDAPGLNPQGTVMSIADRNCERLLAGARA
jgi:choline dehydrogenase-like flavoprotein